MRLWVIFSEIMDSIATFFVIMRKETERRIKYYDFSLHLIILLKSQNNIKNISFMQVDQEGFRFRRIILVS